MIHRCTHYIYIHTYTQYYIHIHRHVENCTFSERPGSCTEDSRAASRCQEGGQCRSMVADVVPVNPK